MPDPGFAKPDLCSICAVALAPVARHAARTWGTGGGCHHGPPQPADGGRVMTVFAAVSGRQCAAAASGIDRAIRLSTAAAVLAVAGIAAYVSYWHAYAVVRAHGESGITARLEPATIDGLVYASSMLVLYAARHRVPVPCLARWLLGLGIAATLTANMAQGWSRGPVGAVVAAWPAVSLVGSYELSLGVSSLLHDVALKRFTESLCNTSATCGARCRRCSEACPPRTGNMCNTLGSRRRGTYPPRPARSAGSRAMPVLHTERMNSSSGSSASPGLPDPGRRQNTCAKVRSAVPWRVLPRPRPLTASSTA